MSSLSLLERVNQSGVGLSDATLEWASAGPLRTTAIVMRDVRLLSILHDANYLSASQLTLLGWGTDTSSARRRLKRLHSAGLVDRFRPKAAIGSYEWNYRLTTRGWELLGDHSQRADDQLYTPAELHSISYAEHDLQVNALTLAIAQQACPADTRGPLLDRLPFEWHGPRRGEINPRHETTTEPSAAASVAEGVYFHPEQSRAGILRPDATLISATKASQFAVMIEYDRTQRPHKQLDRLRRYDHYLLEGWHNSRHAHHDRPPSVVFVTQHEGPLEALIQAADHTLTGWYATRMTDPSDGCYPGRDRVLFTSLGRLRGGNWTMKRVPNLPPNLRRSRNSVRSTTRSVTYELPKLFAGTRRCATPEGSRQVVARRATPWPSADR